MILSTLKNIIDFLPHLIFRSSSLYLNDYCNDQDNSVNTIQLFEIILLIKTYGPISSIFCSTSCKCRFLKKSSYLLTTCG